MGVVASKNHDLHGTVAKCAANKFDAVEVQILNATWHDLADRSNHNGKGVNKDVFLQYFPLDGLLGERLFAQFDTGNSGYLNFDEFITGLATVCRGTMDEKIHFIFNMYDVSHDNTVTKEELTTLLNHIPKVVLHGERVIRDGDYATEPSAPINHTVSHSDTESEPDQHPGVSTTESFEVTPIAEEGDVDFEEVDTYTNHDMVEKAFLECDLNHEGRLHYEEFKMWMERNPSVMNYISNILPYTGVKDLTSNGGGSKRDSLPRLRRSSTIAHDNRKMSMRGTSFSVQNSNYDGTGLCSPKSVEGAGNLSFHSPESVTSDHNKNHTSLMSRIRSVSLKSPPTPPPSGDESRRSGKFRLTRGSSKDRLSNGEEYPFVEGEFDDVSNGDVEEKTYSLLSEAFNTTQHEEIKDMISQVLGSLANLSGHSDTNENGDTKEGNLWKKGKYLHIWSKRYYLLSGNCIYYYAQQNNNQPKGVIFLTGSIVERLEDKTAEMQGNFGFEIVQQDGSIHSSSSGTQEHHRHEHRTFYCKSAADRDEWVTSLQRAAEVVPIEDDYVIGRVLGDGRFSVVKECVHKQTGRHFAVKIIDKTTIEPGEKVLLRTEIAILKLVDHPNIIRMEGLYESKRHIYIVMEMLLGGELFERIVGRPRFTEPECARLLRPLLESVAYLHDLGIAHRDLKPENILCGESAEDVKIADFGLSKMILPKEKMDGACGTLSYAAPEVLTMQGYGMQADIWSVGVITFLLLCGRLPFDGDNQKDVIRMTIQDEPEVNPAVWARLSDEARSLIGAFLTKNPNDRITARNALQHPFIHQHAPAHHHSHRRIGVSTIGTAVGSMGTMDMPASPKIPNRQPSSSPAPFH